MAKITQYWDDSIKKGIYVEDGKIRHFFDKKPFNYTCFDATTLINKMRKLFAQIGTAYHSGNEGTHISDFLGKQSLINISRKMEVTIASNYSICDEEIDCSEFYHKNMKSFYTPEIELMPLLGYVVLKEKITEPLHSFYEMKNKLQKKEGCVDCDEVLNGDCLGQMALAMSCGGKVLNNICVTPFKNFFYGRVLSANRIIGAGGEVVLARIKEIKPVVPCAYDLASCWNVPSTDIGIDCYGNCKIHMVRDDEIAQINTIGYLGRFSNGTCNVLYSYPKDVVKHEFEAGWNCINLIG
jgi:hypothetical protein